MEVLNTVWDFFQNEVLGMKWLNRLIGNMVEATGLDAFRADHRIGEFSYVWWRRHLQPGYAFYL